MEPNEVDHDGPLPENEEKGPDRKCVVSGAVRPKEQMIRFVVGPDRTLVPDVDARLPGRGIWLSAGRDMVNTAVAKNLFAKAARGKVALPAGCEGENLADLIERLLTRRCLDILGLARRAGQLVSGYEKVRAELKARRGAVLLAASDAAAGGRDKIRALAPSLPLVDLLTGAELGSALGRDAAVHAVLSPGRLAERFLQETARLSGFRTGGQNSGDLAATSE